MQTVLQSQEFTIVSNARNSLEKYQPVILPIRYLYLIGKIIQETATNDFLIEIDEDDQTFKISTDGFTVTG